VIDTQQRIRSGGQNVDLIGIRLDRFYGTSEARTRFAANPCHTFPRSLTEEPERNIHTTTGHMCLDADRGEIKHRSDVY
jgi:hypothetical protein